MAYVTIPKDLTKVQSKVLFNLTKRQLIYFTPVVLIGVPLFFLTRSSIGDSAATLLMIMVMLPFFLFAMYEHNGQHLEEYLKNMYNTKIKRPKERPYQTNNLYVALNEQRQLEKEVKRIIKYGNNKKEKQINKKTKEGNQSVSK